MEVVLPGLLVGEKKDGTNPTYPLFLKSWISVSWWKNRINAVMQYAYLALIFLGGRLSNSCHEIDRN